MPTPINAPLINRKDGLTEIETPALILDKPRLEQNLTYLADHCRKYGRDLRPHAKTHKCAEIAQRQIELGAVGICCAKVGEAESFARQGITNFLLTSPIVTTRSIERVTTLVSNGIDIQLVADHEASIRKLSAHASREKVDLEILVDVDPGMHRTGAPFEKVLELARLIQTLPGLRFGGLQIYAGNLMHIQSYTLRKQRASELAQRIQSLVTDLGKHGIHVARISGGGTGTFDIDMELGTFTELQAGSYGFMDVQYQAIEYAGNEIAPFQTSLFVATRLISSNTPGLATTDAGFKAFATDDCPPQLRDYDASKLQYRFMGDEHGALVWTDTALRFQPGQLIYAITPHCDPTVNLYDYIHVVENNVLVDIWPIDARGQSA